MSGNNEKRKRRKTDVQQTIASAPNTETDIGAQLQRHLESIINDETPRISLKTVGGRVLCGGTQPNSKLVWNGESAFGRWWSAREPQLADFCAVQSRFGTTESLFDALVLPFRTLFDASGAPDLFAILQRSGIAPDSDAMHLDGIKSILLRYVLATNVPQSNDAAFRHILQAYDAAWLARNDVDRAPFYVSDFSNERSALMQRILSPEHCGSFVDLWLWQRATRYRVAVLVLDTAYDIDCYGSILCHHLSNDRRTPPKLFVLLAKIGARFVRVQRSDGQYLFERQTLARALPALWREYERQCTLGVSESILWRAVSDFVLRQSGAVRQCTPLEQFERLACQLWGGRSRPIDLFAHVDELCRFPELSGNARKALFERLCEHGEAQEQIWKSLLQNIDTPCDVGDGKRQLQVLTAENALYNFEVAPHEHPTGDDLSNAERGKVWRLRRNTEQEAQWWVLKFVNTCDQVDFHCTLREDMDARRFIVPLVFHRCAKARLWSANKVPGEWRSAKVTHFIGSGGARRRAASGASQEENEQRQNAQNRLVRRAEATVKRAMERAGKILHERMNLFLHDNDWRARQNRIEVDDRILYHDFDRTVRRMLSD